MFELIVGKLVLPEEMGGVTIENVSIKVDPGPYLEGLSLVLKASPNGIGKFFDAIGEGAAVEFEELRTTALPLLLLMLLGENGQDTAAQKALLKIVAGRPEVVAAIKAVDCS
jgi:hypothetical protein